MRSGPVTANRIVGAVAVYLLVALLFALLFDILDHVAPVAFTLEPEPLPFTRRGAVLLPIDHHAHVAGPRQCGPPAPARPRIVMVEAVVGQFYTTVLVARLVSQEVAHRLEELEYHALSF